MGFIISALFEYTLQCVCLVSGRVSCFICEYHELSLRHNDTRAVACAFSVMLANGVEQWFLWARTILSSPSAHRWRLQMVTC